MIVKQKNSFNKHPLFLGIIAFFGGVAFNIVSSSLGLIGCLAIGLIIIYLLLVNFMFSNGNISFIFFLLLIISGYPFILNIAGRTPKVYWIEIAIPILLIFIFIKKTFIHSIPQTIPWRFPIRTLSLLLYVVAIFLGLLIHQPIDPLRTGAFLIPIVLGISSYFLIGILIDTKSKLLLFCKVIPLASLFLFGQFMYSALLRFGWHFTINYRVHSLIDIDWGRSNFIAAFFALTAVLNFGAFLSKSDLRWKLVTVIAIIVSLLAITVISSMGAIVSVIISFISYFIFLPGKKIHKSIAIISLILVVLLISPATDYIFKRFTRAYDQYIEQPDARRIHIWQNSWEIFSNHPLVGVGLGNKGFITLNNLGFYYPTSHNFVLQSLSETGLLGTIFLLFFYGNIFFQAFKLNYDKYIDPDVKPILIGITLALIVGFCHALVEPNLLSPSYRTFFWVVLGYVVVLSRHKIKYSEGR